MSKAKKPKVPKAKVSFRHNFLPPIMGIFSFIAVLGLLNGQWIVAQAQYSLSSPVQLSDQQINTNSPAGITEPRVTISKINVSAPVVFDEPSFNEAKVQLALRRGVLHYGSTAVPGQKGNAVLFGHSSGQLWAPGSYKFVFTLLDKLEKDDKIIVDYKGTRYIYKVTDKKVVDPSDLRVLDQTATPTLSLITCTPVGTSKYRLVVHAEQISPKPDTATQSLPKEDITPKELPGSAGKSAWKTLTNPFSR